MHCDIISVSDLNAYYHELARWEKESQRQKDEFVIEDKKHPTTKPVQLIEHVE